MTHELKMSRSDLQEIAGGLRYLANREDECSGSRRRWGQLAATVEEQVKPAIEEPKEFGSIVRAISGLSVNGTLWQRTPGHGEHHWEDEHGCVEVWSELTDVEVLRVGLGEKPWVLPVDAYTGGQEIGERAFAGKIRARLIQLLDEAITSERKNAYEKAIQAVEELAP